MELTKQPPGPSHLEDGEWKFGYKHARDIPDERFLDAVRALRKKSRFNDSWQWVNRWELTWFLSGAAPTTLTLGDDAPGVPQKVVLAKMKRLLKRKLIDCCPCGCRGDIEIVGE